MTQLTAQGSAGFEIVSVQTLPVQFLNANRIAAEDTCKVGWNYDMELWETASDWCKRKDPTLS
eukprot:2983820-Karenia_brevis.AAC.1